MEKKFLVNSKVNYGSRSFSPKLICFPLD